MGQRRLAALVVIVAAALGASGCGSFGDDRGAPQRATLLLDFTPNAVHAGIYRALARGEDRRHGVRLTVRQPGDATDPVKLLAAGTVDFAVLDIHDLALAREKGRDLVGVLALVQRPLAAVIAQPGIRSPRLLEGKTVGVTGLPSDVAVVRSEVQGAGGDPARVRFLTIGFNAVASLLSRRVDAATGFWDVEGIALTAKRAVNVFRVDSFGAPPYPELVVCVSRRTLRERPELVQDVRATLRTGYEDTVRDPAAALRDLWRAVPALDHTQSTVGLTELVPAFVDGIRPIGRLDPARMRRWAAWEAKFKLVRTPPDVARTFTLGA